MDGGALSCASPTNGQAATTMLHSRVLYQVHAFGTLAPFLPILLWWPQWPSPSTGEILGCWPVAVLGGALGFDMLSYLSNAIESAPPVLDRVRAARHPAPGIAGGGGTDAPSSSCARPVRNRSSRPGARALVALAAVCLVLVVMIPTTLSTRSGMLNPQIGVEESQQIGFIFKAQPNVGNFFYRDAYPFALAMDRYFERRHLPDGDVVVDNSTPRLCPDDGRNEQPAEDFVIPNDQDFQRVLADPLTFHAHYILVPDPNTARAGRSEPPYPSLWRTGAGFTKMVHQFRTSRGRRVPISVFST